MSKWISVGDKMPRNGQTVLFLSHGDIHVGYVFGPGIWMDAFAEESIVVVTHWMPLPAPPEEE